MHFRISQYYTRSSSSIVHQVRGTGTGIAMIKVRNREVWVARYQTSYHILYTS